MGPKGKKNEVRTMEARTIQLIEAADMPHEIQRVALGFFDQLIARGVNPDKAAYTTATVFYGYNQKGNKEA